MFAKEEEQISKQAKSALPKSRQQPIWHVITLNILTICGYSFVWFYKNWKQLNKFAKIEYKQLPDAESKVKGSPELWKYFANMRPSIHTFGIFIPYMQLYFFFLAFKQNNEISPKNKYSPYLVGLLLTVCYAGLLQYGNRMDLLALLALASTFPLAYSQYHLNAFWQSVEPPEAQIRQSFNVEEIFFLIFGFFALLLYVIFLIFGPLITKFLGQAIKI